METITQYKERIQRLLDGTASDEDRETLRASFERGELTVASGPRSVAIGGSAVNSVINTGDGTVVMSLGRGAGKDAIESLFPARLHQLPPAPADFSAREDELREMGAAVEQGARLILLHGMPGGGKSTLALKFAEAMKSRFPGAQLYLDLRGMTGKPATPREAMEQVIRAFRAKAQTPESEPELRALYLSLVSEQPCLLVLDNATEEWPVGSMLAGAGCLVIVTSQSILPLPGGRHWRVDPVSPEQAEDFLTRVVGRDIPAQAAKRICELCENLFLALRAAGSLLAVYVDQDAGRYADQLQVEKERLQRIGTVGVPMGVEACLRLSYKQLKMPTKRVFRHLAVFPETFDSFAEKEICKDDGNLQLQQLTRCSLVQFSPVASRYRLHDLIRIFANQQSKPKDLYAVEKAFAKHYRGMAFTAEMIYREAGQFDDGLALLDAEWNNIQAGRRWAARYYRTDPEAAEQLSRYPDAAVYLFRMRQNASEQTEWLEDALRADEVLGMQESRSWHIGAAGAAFLSAHQLDRALDYFEEALAIARDTGDRISEAISLGNLGVVYVEKEEFTQAIEFLQEAINLENNISGPEWDRTQQRGLVSAPKKRSRVVTLMNLGSAYLGIGDAATAIPRFEEALAIAETISAPVEEVNLLRSLGVAWMDLQQLDRAVDYYRRAWAKARQSGDRRGELIVLGNLAFAERTAGRWPETTECYERGFELAKELDDRGRSLAMLQGWVTGLRATGNISRATELCQTGISAAEAEGDEQMRAEFAQCWELLRDVAGIDGRVDGVASDSDGSLSADEDPGGTSGFE